MKAIKHSLLLICLCATLTSVAQKPGPMIGTPNHPVDLKAAVLTAPTVRLNPNNLEIEIRNWLLENHKNFNSDGLALQLIAQRTSKTGPHYSFQQQANGVAVYRGRIKVNCNNDGTIRSILDNSYSLIPAQLSTDFPGGEIVAQFLKDRQIDAPEILRTEPVYFHRGNAFEPCLKLEIAESVASYFEAIVDADGKALYERDLNAWCAPPSDTTVSAKVFAPDPLTTAQSVYVAPFLDNDDADSQELNDERIAVDVHVDYQQGWFRAFNNYAQIMDFSPPSVQAVAEQTPVMEYTREQSGFEDMMVLYYLYMYQTYIQDLGFTDLVNYQIHVDTHGLNGSDNSNFNSAWTVPRITFGEGGVDDAEDTDVVIHEYGHAIAYSAAPGSNGGTERKALDEALGDYLAGSYSHSVSQYHWGDVYSWDGHNEFWAGRRIVSTDKYPDDLVLDIYDDADIWAGTLMQINQHIGRDKTEEILFESLYGYEVNMTMEQAATLFIQADSALNNGNNYPEICFWMNLRGLTGTCVVGHEEAPSIAPQIRVLNSEGFAAGDKAWIVLGFPANATVTMLDVSGRVVSSQAAVNSDRLAIDGANLSSGLYVVEVETGGQRSSFKLVRQ